MKNIVEVKNFQMAFDGKVVIKDLSFDVKRGEIFFYKPNCYHTFLICLVVGPDGIEPSLYP